MTFYGNVLAGERTEKCGAREKDNKKRPNPFHPPRPRPHNDDAVMNMIVLIITL
jgi:hypothetical protein